MDLTYIQQSGDAALPPGTVANAGDPYTGLDRFGRVRDQRWRLSGGSHTDRFGYGHDKNSNPQYRENLVNPAFSELYHANGAAGEYDKLDQLPAFARGTLNAAKDTIAAPARSQSWAYDGQGNWSTVTTDLTPVTRTHNRQNQITSGGVTYDADGNLTADGSGKTFVYDAWNRLKRVEQGMTVLAGYGYDALGRRVVEAEGGVTRDLYYSAAWQVLEEHAGGQVKAQNVWSPVYVDALVLRDRDADGNGSLEERLWVQQDANYNVTALVNGSGAVVERYVYDPYGAVTALTPAWASLGGSAYGWVYLHQGGRYSTATGLYNFRNRDYAPTLGRWLETDPIRFTGGDTNLYRYVGNRPTGSLDPAGLQWRGTPAPLPPDRAYRNTEPPVSLVTDAQAAEWQARMQREMMDPMPWLAVPLVGRDLVGLSRKPGAVGQPGFLEGLTPGWGGSRSTIDHFQNDEVLFGAVSAAGTAAEFVGAGQAVRGGARLLRGGGSSLVREIFRGGSRWSAVEKVAPTITERAGLGIGPFASRTPKLPQSATVAEILEHGWIPGREGITLSDGTVRFADLYRMTEAHGIEFGLTREVVDGKSVYRLYSGGRNAVTMPSGEGVRIIGHTHPSGYRLPSTADIDNLNRAFLNSLERDLLAPVPHRRVIWGSGPANSTIYYPNVLR